MNNRTSSLILIVTLAILTIPSFSFISSSTASDYTQSELYDGPYLSKVVYNVIETESQAVTALQNNDLDMIGEVIDSSYIPTLEATEHVEVMQKLRNGYGSMIINTAKNPLNYTAFRRALAFAIDKEGIASDVFDGTAYPLDSVVPDINPFSCEGLLGYDYYADNIAIANQLLEDAGFTISGTTGFRMTPQGDEFSIKVEVASTSTLAIEIGNHFEYTLGLLQINATSVPTDAFEYIIRLQLHDDYDIAFLGKSYSNFDVDWLAYDYWSDYSDVDYYNYPNWENSTYDSWRDQLLHATEYEDVYEAAFEMQKIWVHACPEIICYENIEYFAHRTDQFTGFVNDVQKGLPSWWTNFKTHLPSALGGTLRWSNPNDIDGFNIMTSNSVATLNVLQMLYDSLLIRDPDGTPIPWLANTYKTEVHSDNGTVPADHTRFTLNLLQNATWSDLTPITAEDVAYCLNYYKDSAGLPYGIDLVDMSAAYTTSTYQVVVEFDSESYWHLSSFAFKPILPKSTLLSIGSGWSSWNPTYSSLVTSGPFYVSGYSSGEYIELSQNLFYYRDGTITPITTDTTTTIPTQPEPMNHSLYYDVDVGDRLDVEVDITSTYLMTTIPQTNGVESAYFIADGIPVIPDSISSIMDIPPLNATLYWANGTEWVDQSLSTLMAMPLGNWSFYASLWEVIGVYDVVETDTSFSISVSLTLLNTTLTLTREQSKSTGLLNLYLSGIYMNEALVESIRIQVPSPTSSSSTIQSTSNTTTSSTSPTSSLPTFNPMDTITMVIVFGCAAVVIIVVIVIIRGRR